VRPSAAWGEQVAVGEPEAPALVPVVGLAMLAGPEPEAVDRVPLTQSAAPDSWRPPVSPGCGSAPRD
jgi:hypothetical protein